MTRIPRFPLFLNFRVQPPCVVNTMAEGKGIPGRTSPAAHLCAAFSLQAVSFQYSLPRKPRKLRGSRRIMENQSSAPSSQMEDLLHLGAALGQAHAFAQTAG